MNHDNARSAENSPSGATIDELRTNPSLLAHVRDLQDTTAWQRFLKQYEPIIVRWCLRSGLQRADAQDVTQNVLVKLAQALPHFQYNSSKRFRNWLATIFRNALRDWWRRRAARPGDVATGDSAARAALEQFTDPAAVDADSFAEELDTQLRPALLETQEIAERVRKRVEPHTWRAFWMTAIDGEPGPVVARRLRMKVAHVYVAKGRVIKLLHEERDGRERSGDTTP